MRICRAPGCENIAINQRTVCTKHKHRLRNSGTFELTERISKADRLTGDFVKSCKVHGLLKFDQVYTQKRKNNNKIYKSYSCRECISLKKQRLYNANPEKYRKYALIMRKKHYENNIKRDRAYKLKNLINIKEYEQLVIKQNNLCAICKKPEKAKVQKSRTGTTESINEIKRLAIDHCHIMELQGIIKIRGLLCQKCNTALGSFDDSIENLQSAIEYLKSNQ